MATRRVVGMTGLEYDERLRQLRLLSLEQRREREDMIETHKITHKLHSFELTLFQMNDRTERDYLKIYKPRHRTLKRGKFFSQRVINKWNSLNNEIKGARTSYQFKSRYDKKP